MDNEEKTITESSKKRLDHNGVAYEIVAILAERGATVSDSRTILGYVNDLLAHTPVVRLSR